MVGHRTVNAAVAGSSPAIRAISLFLRLNVHVFTPRLAVIATPLMCTFGQHVMFMCVL